VSKFTSNRRIQQLDVELEGVKPISLAFDGEDVSGNGGALLLAQAERETGLVAGAAARLKDHRTGSLIKHSVFEQVLQRVVQICSGASAASDSNFLRFDPAIKMAVGRNPLSDEALASQPTQHRLETTRGWKELYLLCLWLVDYYIHCHPKRPKSLVLDFDGSAIETHGLQLNAFYRSGPYGKFMYFPLFVFDEQGWLLVAALRPGDHGEVTWALPILKRLVKRLREAWPGIEITIRADGAFTDAALYQWLDDNDVNFALGLKHNNVLLTKTKSARQKAAKKFYRKFGCPLFEGKLGAKRKLETLKYIRGIRDSKERREAAHLLGSRQIRVFDDFQYAANSWDRKRRVIARLDFDDEGVNVRYIVTNITKLAPSQIYEQIYCKRALVELCIKNMKETRCERLSCAQFRSNMFRLLLHAFAYILLYQVRLRLAEEHRTISFSELRDRFMRVPCVIVEKRTRIHLRFSVTFRDSHEFRLAARRFHQSVA
jgi:hypothetical protein